MLTGAKTDIFIVAESSWGVTPDNPVFVPVPATSFNPGVTRELLTSGKLRRDRQVEDVRLGNLKVMPVIKGELELESWDALIEAAMMGTWTSNAVSIGSTRRSFTILARLDLSTDEYHLFKGCEVTSMELSTKPNGFIDISFAFSAKVVSLVTAEPTGATYATAANRSPITGWQGILNTGNTYATEVAIATDFSLKVENGIEPSFVIGSQYSIRGPEKRGVVTGSFSAYYEDKTWYEYFLGESTPRLRLVASDPAGSIYFQMPRCIISSGAPDIGGESGVIATQSFSALYQVSPALSALTISRPSL